MAEQIKVLKRDGSVEEFKTEKIVRVAEAAGVKAQKAEALAGKVAGWVKSSGENPISSFKIRDKVVEEMEKVNQYTAGLYKWYEKNKRQRH